MKILKKITQKWFLFTVAFALLVAIAEIGVSASGVMTIQNRLGLPTLNIINDMSITFIDNNGNPISGDPNINSRARIRFDWALFDRDANGNVINELETDRIRPGDTFTFTLPSAFRVANTINNINLSGFGTATIATNNIVTLTFNELVSQSSRIEGFIEFSASLNEAVLQTPGLKEVLLPIREQVTFTFNLVPTNLAANISKHVHAIVASANELNPSSITWEVQVNRAFSSLSNVVVTDILPASLRLSAQPDAIVVLPLFLNLDGTLRPLNQRYGAPLLEGVDYSVSGTELTFLRTINTPYAIRFRTDIVDSFKPPLGGNLAITNQATLSSTGVQTLQASATYTAVYGRLLTKTRVAYNADAQEFTWRIAYNFGEITLTNPVLVDTFSSNMTFVPGTLTVRNLTNQLLVPGVDYNFDFDNDANTLTISFVSTITQAYNIEYRTRIRDTVIVSGGNLNVSNSVTSEGVTSVATGTVTPRVVVKSSPSINYATRQINWQIDLNNNRYSVHNAVLTDVFDSLGMNLVSIVVRNRTLNTIVNPNNYVLTKTYNDAGVETGFRLEFINNYATFNDSLRVEFVTAYDMNAKPNISGIARNRFRNTARLEWVDFSLTSRNDVSSANRDVNTQTVLNGQKSGNYNAVTKEITWNVRVNYHNDVLVQPRLVDPILGNQVFIPESLEIFEYRVNANGTMTRIGSSLNLNDFVIDFPNATNGFVLTIDFPTNSVRHFEIEFRTSLREQMIENRYTNTATFLNNGRIHPLDASVSITHGGDLITKAGVQAGSLIRWSMLINQSQSTIRDAVIEDIPSVNQRLVLDSFRLFSTTVAANGTYTINRNQPLVRGIDYELTFIFLEDGSQRFNLKFLHEITRPYVLEYDSEINTTPGNLAISNSAIMTGNGVRFEQQGESTTVIINIVSAGGGAVGVQGSLQVKKINPAGDPLQGVVFHLINRHNRVIAAQATNAQGVVTFRNLVFGTYTLREVDTVGSYVISDELFVGKSVVIGTESSNPQVFTIVTNRKNQTQIRKVDSMGLLLEGSEFRLEFLGTNGWITLFETLELTAGTTTLEGLSVGRYRLIELAAPEGFILNTNPLEFEITRNQNGQAQDKIVEFVNYQGSVRLLKTDTQGNVLENVVFNLLSQNGELLVEGLKTNADGEIKLTNLKPGAYQFVETASVQGNVVNTTPILFIIESSHDGKPDVIQLSARNGRASVELRKVDQVGNPIEGVQFALYKVSETRTLISDDILSQSDGLVRIDHLSPGKYQLVEIMTVAGFILNTTTIEFEVAEEAQTDHLVITLDDFVNYQGSIRIIKVNRFDRVIGEATFEVYFGEELVQTLSTVNGILELKNLAPGVYTFVEIEAPEGYILDDTPLIITIADAFEGTVETIEIRFMNLGGNLLGDGDENIPPTGDRAHSLPWFLLILGVVGLIISNKKKKVS